MLLEKVRTSQLTHRQDKSQVIALIVLSALYFDCLSGLLRYIFAQIDVAILIYTPFFLIFSYMLITPFLPGYKYTKRPLIWFIYAFFAFYFIYSLFNLSSFEQVAFAFYAWAPFFAGLIFASEGNINRLLPHLRWIWILSITGVVLNYFFEFPWIGQIYEVLGVNITAARDWDAGGIKRLAGFSRASYTAASQVALFGCIILAGQKNFLLRFSVFAISLIAILLTTSKTPAIGMIVVYLFIITSDFIHNTFKLKKLGYAYSYISVCLLMAAVTLIPIIYVGTSNLNINMSFSGSLSFISVSSMIDRMTQMWPDAFNLISRDNAFYEWFLGRGLGGIGAGPRFDEANIINAADNLFVYLYVTFGALSFIFAAIILKGFSALKTSRCEIYTLYASLLVYTLTLGITSCIIEGVCPLFFLGLVSGIHAKGLEKLTPTDRMATAN